MYKHNLCFSKFKNIPDQLSDYNEGKIKENIDFKYFSNRASFMGNPVHTYECTVQCAFFMILAIHSEFRKFF